MDEYAAGMSELTDGVNAYVAGIFGLFCFLAGSIVRFASRGKAEVKRFLLRRIRKKWNYFAAKICGKAQKRIEIKKKKRYNKKSTEKGTEKQRTLRKKPLFPA